MLSIKDKSRNGPRGTSHEMPLQDEAVLRSNAKVVQSKRAPRDELSLADDDRGGDPYNSTGAYCIIKSNDIAGE